MYNYGQTYQIIGGRLTKGVKYLIIITSAIYILELISKYFDLLSLIIVLMGLTPSLLFQNLYLHQIFTYMFLHSPNDPSHLLLNMLALWMFGSPLEEKWGTRVFLKFYFICGIAGGILTLINGLIFTSAYNIPTIGQSGAIFGLIGAFCTIYSESRILFYFLIPIKARHMLLLIVLIAVIYALAGSPYSFPAHMGGLLAGIIIIKRLYIPSVLLVTFKDIFRRLRRKKLRVIDENKYIN